MSIGKINQQIWLSDKQGNDNTTSKCYNKVINQTNHADTIEECV